MAAATVDAATSPSSVAIFGAVVGAAAVIAAGFLNYITQRWIQKQQRRTSDQQLTEQRTLFERQLAEQRETSQSQLESAHQQLALLREGQITERFMRAIENLGSSNTYVRVGSIFALERIAKESEDHRPYVVSTLATLIRESLPALNLRESKYVTELQVRAPDAQAALTALCRSPLSDDRHRWTEVGGLDLSRADLRRAVLRGADLRCANLYGCRLEGADLHGADLRDSVLSEANFGAVDQGNAAFRQGADLRNADLRGAQFKKAHNLANALTEGALGLSDG